MSDPQSPTIRRWEVATRLRRLREASGLSLDEVAAQLLCSTSKVSRIETAARGASLRDVRDLCRLYGVDNSGQQELMDLVRESKQPGWWRSYSEVDARAGTYIGLEDAATALNQHETLRIPGLLQTTDYTKELIRRTNFSVDEDGIEQFARSRHQRRQVLLSEPRPNFWAILDESALRRQVGGVKVMADQLDFLISCATDRLVTLQVVAFEAGAHAAMDGPFTILEFADSPVPDIVLVEGRTGDLFLSRPAELASYRQAFDHLRAAALSLDDSLDLIHRVRAQISG